MGLPQHDQTIQHPRTQLIDLETAVAAPGETPTFASPEVDELKAEISKLKKADRGLRLDRRKETRGGMRFSLPLSWGRGGGWSLT
jgi:hypothetical protein